MTATPPAAVPKPTFADYVEKRSTTPKELPLVHTTECSRLSSIQAAHAIEPRPCSVFDDEPLLYLFYGRPAYRDPTKTTPIKDVSFCPICFIFKPGMRLGIKRIYPFDTGASQKRLYVPEITKAKALRAYQVRTVAESARRIIDGFFETNEKYMGNQPKSGLVFAAEETDAEAYYKLINGGGNPKCDDRRSAIEFQTDQVANLRRDLKAVALPTSFLEDPDLTRVLVKEWRAQPLTYDADIGMRPTEFHGAIRMLIRNYFRLKNFI